MNKASLVVISLVLIGVILKHLPQKVYSQQQYTASRGQSYKWGDTGHYFERLGHCNNSRANYNGVGRGWDRNELNQTEYANNSRCIVKWIIKFN